MENEEQRIVGWTLCVGAYASIGLITLGAIISAFHGGAGAFILKAGFLLLMFTPTMRILVAGLVFLHTKDYRYAFISLIVLTIVVTTCVLAMLGVLNNV